LIEDVLQHDDVSGDVFLSWPQLLRLLSFPTDELDEVVVRLREESGHQAAADRLYKGKLESDFLRMRSPRSGPFTASELQEFASRMGTSLSPSGAASIMEYIGGGGDIVAAATAAKFWETFVWDAVAHVSRAMAKGEGVESDEMLGGKGHFPLTSTLWSVAEEESTGASGRAVGVLEDTVPLSDLQLAVHDDEWTFLQEAGFVPVPTILLSEW
jgi:hypothetical protein